MGRGEKSRNYVKEIGRKKSGKKNRGIGRRERGGGGRRRNY